MGTAKVNGVQLFYELSGTGEVPLVLVHGSWGSHNTWAPVVPALAESFRVLTYDRRGHSESERPTSQGSVREDVADLAALIEHLALAPAWVGGNSFGASITLRLAGEHSDLLRGVIAHEPPLFSLADDDPDLKPIFDEAGKRVGAVVERIASGDHAGAAEQFVETVALGPGSWAKLPPDLQQRVIVSVQIDGAGRHDATACIQLLRPATSNLSADHGDSAVLKRHVRPITRNSGTFDNGATSDDNIELSHWPPPVRQPAVWTGVLQSNWHEPYASTWRTQG